MNPSTVQQPDPTRAIRVEKFGMQTTMSPEARTSSVRRTLWGLEERRHVMYYCMDVD